MAGRVGNATAVVLCTDLVGSTALLARLGERAFDGFRRTHFEALRRALDEHGGQEIKTLGDGMLAVFTSAADALSCAIAMQKATRATDCAIRVGLAVGDVAREDDDVFGVPVVQAARLTAAAEGGQILATSLVPSVAGGRSTAHCVDLGMMDLKGLPEAVAVSDVRWNDPFSEVEIRVLGEVDVAVGGRVVEISSAKQRTVLAVLALRAGVVVSADALIEALWGDQPPPSAASTLRSVVARLRKVLEAAGVPAERAQVRGRGAGYVLEVEPGSLDVARFEALVAEAMAAGDPARAERLLQQALALWRGPAFGGPGTIAFVEAEAARLEELRLLATEELAEARLALGRAVQALGVLEALVAEHPLRERAWAGLMLARYRLGRQAEALADYRRVRALLAEELGIEPTPMLRDLHERILRQASDLDLEVRPVAVRPSRLAHNLPTALASFVGRQIELDQLDALTAQYRLVTLTGAGGCGKSRLALEWAHTAVDRHPDGVRLVDLTTIQDPDLVVAATATGLGFVTAALASEGRDLLDGLCDRLAARRLLVVLDNCEHVVEPVAQMLRAVLTTCPAVTVLATSRAVLGVPGEVVFRVPSLPLPPHGADAAGVAASDAAQLFCERARAAVPGFGVTETNATAIGEVCRRLDGIPLALELAAPRVRILGAVKLAQRLTQRLGLLTGGVSGLARHQTLRAAIDWSYDLLPAREKTVLARLAVFPGTFEIEAAEAVVGALSPGAVTEPGFEVLDLLTRLVDKSLVVVVYDGDDVRYCLLETIREYAAEQLQRAGETEAAHRAHRDHFLAVARRHPLDQNTWAARFRFAAAEIHNIRTALRWSQTQGDHEAALRLIASVWLYWETMGGEGLAWLESAVAGPEPADVVPLVEAKVGLAWALRNRGLDHTARAEELCRAAVALAERHDLPKEVGKAHTMLIELAFATGRPADAEQHAHLALEAFSGTDSRSGPGIARLGIGMVRMAAGQLAEALEQMEAALDLLRDDQWLRPHALGDLALACAISGDGPGARRWAEEGLLAARQVPARQIVVMALTRAVQAAILCGDLDRAHALLPELLALLREIGFQRWVADALELSALVLADRRPADAGEALDSAGGVRAALGEGPSIVLADRVEQCRHQVTQPTRRAPARRSTDEALARVYESLVQTRRAAGGSHV